MKWQIEWKKRYNKTDTIYFRGGDAEASNDEKLARD